MFDFYSMEQRMLEAVRAPDARQAEVIRHLLELEREAETPSLRRRVASLILDLALRLDPEAPLIAPRRITLSPVLSFVLSLSKGMSKGLEPALSRAEGKGLSKEAARVRD